MKNKHLITFILGIAAGVAISLGGYLNILAKSFIPNAEIAKIVGSLLFPIGLTLVCYLGLNLFTGKIGYLLDNKKDYVGFLGLVYLGNVVGAVVIGLLSYLILRNFPVIFDVVKTISENKANIASLEAGLRQFGGAILCGALVYLAVYFYKKMPNNILKIVGIFVPIALFVYFGFDHCIANMFYFSFSFSFTNWTSYLNIIIATLGNSLGAIALNFFLR